jgi:hypothetical protein
MRASILLKGKLIGKRATVKRGQGVYLTWEAEEPKDELILSCTDGVDQSNRDDGQLSVPPSGGHGIWTKRYNLCKLEELANQGNWRELSRVYIYTGGPAESTCLICAWEVQVNYFSVFKTPPRLPCVNL